MLFPRPSSARAPRTRTAVRLREFFNVFFFSRHPAAAVTPRARATVVRALPPSSLSSPPFVSSPTMETQVAPSQQLAATQSQKPTTQPYDPTNDPTVQVEADADEASEGEEEVRRAISAFPPRSIARRDVSHPSRTPGRRASRARARLFPRAAVPFLTLFPPRASVVQYEQLPQSFLCIEELQNCGISMTDIKVRASAPDTRPSRAPRRAPPPLRARARNPTRFPPLDGEELLRKIQSPLFSSRASPRPTLTCPHPLATRHPRSSASVIFHRRNAARADSPRSSPC